LTRQKLAVIDRKRFNSAEGLRRGGYVLAEAEEVQSPTSKVQSENIQLILIATGSEVSLALEAREKLQAEGIATRVVSLPCWELFEEQPLEYRNEVLPTNVTARLAIEAGVRQGWDRYVGGRGDVVCLDRFGASAPGDVAMRELGFNVDNVLKRAKALL
jgi:transketolase